MGCFLNLYLISPKMGIKIKYNAAKTKTFFVIKKYCPKSLNAIVAIHQMEKLIMKLAAL